MVTLQKLYNDILTLMGQNHYTKSSTDTLLGQKAPTNHASTATTYGLGSTSNYGHVKTINGLTQASHSDGLALSAYQGNVLNTAISGKAPTSHASTATTYGIGTTANYGHVKTINGLTQASHADGLALSAYQGKVLKDSVDGKAPTSHASTGTTYGIGTTANYGHVKTVNALTTSAHSDGLALSAYQGKVLKDSVDGKAPTNHASTATTYGVASKTNYGHVKVDDELSATSTNPVQNKVVKSAIDELKIDFLDELNNAILEMSNL